MKEKDILEKVGGKTGYTVPPHYFDNFRSKMMENLPEYKVAEQPKLSAWQRVKPYLYMAAMFAGIWCMMKMFHTISSTDLSLDNPPQAVAVAMASSDHQDDWMYMRNDNAETFVLEEELSGSYGSIEDFKKDFENTEI